MKTFKTITSMILTAILPLMATLQSCNDNDENGTIRIANAIVTVKTASDKTTYLQLDDKTTLLPTNIKGTLFDGKQVRAIANISDSKEDAGKFSKAVTVNWIDSIRTKGTNVALPTTEENDKTFGNDPFEIMKDWVTIAEDGYLTLRIRTLWGMNTRHYIYMLTGVNKDNPYEVEIRQDSKGDNGTRVGDSLIAFDLAALPDTQGKTVKLKVRWKSFSGEKSAEFDYCTRTATTVGSLNLTNTKFLSAVK